MRINEAKRPANGRRSRGRPFKPGQSGNPGGRPKGAKTYAIRELVAQALADPATRAAAIAEFSKALTRSKSVISAMEFAAKVNREIGAGSGQPEPSGVTIICQSNVDLRGPVAAGPES